jgi:hypothetical protein
MVERGAASSFELKQEQNNSYNKSKKKLEQKQRQKLEQKQKQKLEQSRSSAFGEG